MPTTAVIVPSTIPSDPDLDNSDIHNTSSSSHIDEHLTNIKSDQMDSLPITTTTTTTTVNTTTTPTPTLSTSQSIDSNLLSSNIPIVSSSPSPSPSPSPSSSSSQQQQTQIILDSSDQSTSLKATVSVPRDAVGFIIGKRGETVRNMMARSNASIEVDRADTSPDAQYRLFHIKGTRQQVKMARQLIKEKVSAVLHERPNARVRDVRLVTNTSQGDDISNPISHTLLEDDNQQDDDAALSTPIEMRIPRGCVGMIIGHNGQVISDMQDRSGATIVVHNRNVDRDGSKLLTISGGEHEKEKARNMIQQILDRAGSRHRHQDRAHQDQNVFIPSPTAQPHPHSHVSPFAYPQMSFDPRQPIPEMVGMSPFAPWIPTIVGSVNVAGVLQQSSQSSQNRSPHPIHPHQVRMIPQPHLQPYQIHQHQQPQQLSPIPSFHNQQEQQQDPRTMLPIPDTLQQHPPQHSQSQVQTDVQAQSPQQPQIQPAPQMPAHMQAQLQAQIQMQNQPQVAGVLPHPQVQMQPILSPSQQQRQTHHQPPSHMQPPQQMQQGSFPNPAVGPHMYPQGAGPAHRNIPWSPHPVTGYSGQPPMRVPYDSSFIPSRGNDTKVVRVPSWCVGILIGKDGETIRDLQTRSHAYIKVTPERTGGSNDPERLIHIIGRPESLELAHSLINDVVNEGISKTYRDGVRPPAETSESASGDSGPSVKRGDEAITTEKSSSSLGSESRQDRNKPHTPVLKQTDEGEENAEATRESVTQQEDDPRASASGSGVSGTQMGISSEVGQEGLSQDEFEGRLIKLPATNYPSASICYEMKILDAKVGVIIGRSGATIRSLQKKSGARINVSKIPDTNRDGKPRAVTITGPQESVDLARRLIIAKINPSSDPTRFEEESLLEGREGEEGVGGDDEDVDLLAMDLDRQHLVATPHQMLPRSPATPMSSMPIPQTPPVGAFQGQFPYLGPSHSGQYATMAPYRHVMRNEGGEFRMVEGQVAGPSQYGLGHVGLSQYSDQMGGFGYEQHGIESREAMTTSFVGYRPPPMYMHTGGGYEVVQAENPYGYGSEMGEMSENVQEYESHEEIQEEKNEQSEVVRREEVTTKEAEEEARE